VINECFRIDQLDRQAIRGVAAATTLAVPSDVVGLADGERLVHASEDVDVVHDFDLTRAFGNPVFFRIP
jgi:hypothetical protein